MEKEAEKRLIKQIRDLVTELQQLQNSSVLRKTLWDVKMDDKLILIEKKAVETVLDVEGYFWWEIGGDKIDNAFFSNYLSDVKKT
jgi:hypothetical protein